MNSTAGDGWLDTAIARHIWHSRYRWMDAQGRPEANIEATWRRVAKAAASVEPADTPGWAQRFYAILEGFRFLPAGRILAGAGTGRCSTLFNCFVMGPVEDDLGRIFVALREGALTMQAGGGVGYDFSALRPAGSPAGATARIASGPVPFLQVWDAMCAAVLSTGARRGAMIASLRCDHPDILAFVDAKRRAGNLTNFNLSVQVPDAMLDAVDRDAAWPLLYPAERLGATEGRMMRRRWPGYEGEVPCRVVRELPARELWQRIMEAAWEGAEPGVLFVDTINRENNLYWREIITTTNPCGEVPLPAYGACNLGSLNLVRFVREPFTPAAALDFAALESTAATAVRLLDNVIDCSGFPLPQQAEQARGSRRIGLGITGLGDALILLGQAYDSDAARALAGRAMRTIAHAAYRASSALAAEKGSFPFYEAGPYLEGSFVRRLPRDMLDNMARHGMRNSHVTAIAPAGTISLLAGNVSSGIEPVFEAKVLRRVLDRNGTSRTLELEDAAMRAWRQAGAGDQPLPPAFVTAQALPAEAHLAMQAALQPSVDSAISKTVNVPEATATHEFGAIFRRAHELGLKGCTVYRPNPLRGAVLEPAGPGRPTAQQANVHCCPFERQGD